MLPLIAALPANARGKFPCGDDTAGITLNLGTVSFAHHRKVGGVGEVGGETTRSGALKNSPHWKPISANNDICNMKNMKPGSFVRFIRLIEQFKSHYVTTFTSIMKFTLAFTKSEQSELPGSSTKEE